MAKQKAFLQTLTWLYFQRHSSNSENNQVRPYHQFYFPVHQKRQGPLQRQIKLLQLLQQVNLHNCLILECLHSYPQTHQVWHAMVEK